MLSTTQHFARPKIGPLGFGEFCLSIGFFTSAMSSCSYCGTQRAALKRCSRCKQVLYCGAECQNAAWKGHEKRCVTLVDVVERVNAANLRRDWQEVLKWEGRMEELLENQPDAGCCATLAQFAQAHGRAFNATGSKDNSLSIVRLETRLVEVLGNMQRFRHSVESPINSLVSTGNMIQRSTCSGHGRLQRRTDSSR